MFKESVIANKLKCANGLLAKISTCGTKEELLAALRANVDANNIIANQSSLTKGDLGKALDKCLALANKAVANVAATEVAALAALTVN